MDTDYNNGLAARTRMFLGKYHEMFTIVKFLFLQIFPGRASLLLHM